MPAQSLLRAVRACLITFLAVGVLGARPALADSVVTRWNDAALQAIRDTHPGPPMVARDLAVLHTSIYDAWAAYDGTAVGTRLGGTLRRPAAERTAATKDQPVSLAPYRAPADSCT